MYSKCEVNLFNYKVFTKYNNALDILNRFKYNWNQCLKNEPRVC